MAVSNGKAALMNKTLYNNFDAITSTMVVFFGVLKLALYVWRTNNFLCSSFQTAVFEIFGRRSRTIPAFLKVWFTRNKPLDASCEMMPLSRMLHVCRRGFHAVKSATSQALVK